MADSLLDRLCENLNKYYISELKELTPADKQQAVRFLKRNTAVKYSVASWNDAHSYLTGQKHVWVTAEEARASLIEWFKK